MTPTAWLRCHGCGGLFDPAEVPAFRCPGAVQGDDIDHVLEPIISGRHWPEDDDPSPLLRYRRMTLGWHLSQRLGMPDDAYVDMVRQLDQAIAEVDGRGFRTTPWFQDRTLGCWVKDETVNVSGSHKGRHLVAVMVYLRVLEETGWLGGRELRQRRLAIASCGNAALGAAVVARAAAWPLDVFVPTDADPAVLEKLGALGADVHPCPRKPGLPGDPAVHAFRQALQDDGALPFSVQGDQNGLAVEGGRTLAWELADQGPLPDALFVQVGGGALASAVWQGLRDALALGRIDTLPHLYTVQTQGAAPLRRAWRRLEGQDLARAALHRGAYMWPWEEVPQSVAHGILDDETYDWWACCQGMRKTDGDAVIVSEADLRHAHAAARSATGIRVSHTGAAGLAGLRATTLPPGATAGVLFTGAER